MSQYLNLKPVEFSSLSAKAQAKINWEGRIAMPKYDGCFAIFLFEHGNCVGILSRDGKPVRSMAHIAADLPTAYPDLTTEGYVAILGEAWSPTMTFADNSGAFRRHSMQAQLGFAPFDFVYWSGSADAPVLSSPLPYRSRLKWLENRATAGAATMIFRPIPTTVRSEEDAVYYAQHLKKVGNYDGAVVSDPDAPYVVSNGSAGEFLKIKPLVSYSLVVLDAEQSVGEKTGRPTGAVLVRWKDGRTFKVGTGFSEAEQADLSTFVGKVIEVSAMGEYPGGALREPRYCGIRDDVVPDF